MRANINLSCEFGEIPELLSSLLNGRESGAICDSLKLTNEISVLLNHKEEKELLTALSKMDELRLMLAKIDNSLIEYNSILSGYLKAVVDQKSPTPMEAETDVEQEDIIESEAEPQDD
jgi:hypothetical protein